MARRIGLAQALINDPELLILDEPTSGMDPIGTRQIKDLLIELAKRGKTILLCSHLLADVEDVCDRIGILYGGRMQVEGTVESLLSCSDRRQIVTGPVSETAVEKIRRIVGDEQSEFEITVPMDKLEEFFIRTVMKAQREKQRTSGAISTTEIGGFLKKDDDTGESILDKLVGAAMEEKTAATAQTVETESVDTAKGRVDIDAGLLDKLTKTSATAEPIETTVSQPKSVEDGPTAEQIKQNILDELTGRAKENTAPDEPDRNEQTGEGDDA
jgi:ABC-2 type transport system ATP-binding protein